MPLGGAVPWSGRCRAKAMTPFPAPTRSSVAWSASTAERPSEREAAGQRAMKRVLARAHGHPAWAALSGNGGRNGCSRRCLLFVRIRARVAAGRLDEVADDGAAVGGEDGFGVELHAFGR